MGVGGILAAAYVLSGVYIVQWDESGVVRRFGEVINADVSPGIHYRLPAPFEEVTLVKADNIQKFETGVQELLSGDTNLVNVNMSVHYRVSNTANYILNVSDTKTLLQASATTSIRSIIGESKIDYILTEGKAEIEKTAITLLQNAMDLNGTGIEIVGIQLIEASPPASVVASFQDLATARQDRSIYINEAMAYKKVSDAEAYEDEKIKTAEGDATLFSEKQSAYAGSKDVTEFRLYMEAMERILPNVQKFLLGDGVNIDNAELWISNNKSIGAEK